MIVDKYDSDKSFLFLQFFPVTNSGRNFFCRNIEFQNSIFRYKRAKRAVRTLQVWKYRINPRPRPPGRD